MFDKKYILIDNYYIEKKRLQKKVVKGIQRRKKCIFSIELQ